MAILPDESGFVGYNPGNGHDLWLIGPIDPTSRVALAAAPPQPLVLAGNAIVEPNVDSSAAGITEAFPYVAAGGTVNTVSL